MAGTTTYLGITYPTSTDYVKDGATAIQTVATGFDSAVAIPTYNAQTGTTYTFALTDVGKTVTASNASASTYTIPPTASVAWPTGTTLEVTNLGAGVVTFAAGAGVTVTNTAATLAQYASAALIRTGLNAWTVTPRSGGASGLTLVKAQTIGTTVSSVTVTDAFSATFDNYKIIISDGVGSTNSGIKLTLGASATTYNYVFFGVNSSGTADLNRTTSTTSFTEAGGCNTSRIAVNLELTNPFLAKQTIFSAVSLGSGVNGGTSLGFHDTASSFTAFTLAPVAGTLTGGTIRVYGYQNS